MLKVTRFQKKSSSIEMIEKRCTQFSGSRRQLQRLSFLKGTGHFFQTESVGCVHGNVHSQITLFLINNLFQAEKNAFISLWESIHLYNLHITVHAVIFRFHKFIKEKPINPFYMFITKEFCSRRPQKQYWHPMFQVIPILRADTSRIEAA